MCVCKWCEKAPTFPSKGLVGAFLLFFSSKEITIWNLGILNLIFRNKFLSVETAMSTTTQIQNINDFVQTFFSTHGVDNSVFDEWKTKETQSSLEILMKSLGGKSESKGKKLKDPNCPKRPKSAYLFFCGEQRQTVQTELDDPTPKNVTVELGVRWNTLKSATDPESKKQLSIYETMADDDKERYTSEMEEYTPPSDEELVEINEKSGKKKDKKKGDGKTENSGPKRPKSAYMFFCGEHREIVKKDLDDTSAKNVMIELGVRWNNLKLSDKVDAKSQIEKYNTMAKDDKERYKTDMENYTPSGDAEIVPKGKTTTKKSKSEESGEESGEEKPVVKKKSGYILYCQQHRSDVKDQNPSVTAVEITKMLAEMWKNLSDEEKEEWKEKA